jgi:predicted  nucleic acid-binding Zn-ribbon protein
MGSEDTTKENDKLDQILARLAELSAVANGSANKIASIETELAEFRNSVETRFASIESRLTSVESRLTSVESRLESREDRFEKKLIETRPIWVAELTNRIDELGNKIDVLSIDVVAVRASYRSVNERLGALEREHQKRV